MVKQNYTVADLNPRAQASKSLEMTVIRCLGLIELFEALEKGQDWTDVEMTGYRRVLGNDHYQQRAVIAEVWKRFRDGTIYREVLDLYANLPPAAQKREEIKNGVHRINARSDSGGQGQPVRSSARGRRSVGTRKR